MSTSQASPSTSQSQDAALTTPQSDLKKKKPKRKTPSSNLPRNTIVCGRCRKGKRACTWKEGSESCERCNRLDFFCTGRAPQPLFGGKGVEKWLVQSLNIAPSSSSQVLSGGILASALVYDLVRVYKEHLGGLRYLDEDLEKFRLGVLGSSGRIMVPEEIGEINIILYALGGAKLTSHSALVGQQSSRLEVGRFVDFHPTASYTSLDRQQVGFRRLSVFQDLSARLLVLLDQLLPSLSPETMVDYVSLAWTCIRELGSAGAHSQDLRAFIKRLRAHLAQFLDPGAHGKLWQLGETLLARDSDMIFYGFLSKWDAGSLDHEWAQSIPRFITKDLINASPLPEFPLLSIDDMRQLVDSDEQATVAAEVSRINEIKSAMVAYGRSVIRLLYDTTLPADHKYTTIWGKLDAAQQYFDLQFPQVVEFCKNNSPTPTSSLTRGVIDFLKILFNLQSSHILFEWTALKESNLRWTASAGPCKTKFHLAISSWVDHTILLMENTPSKSEDYDVGVTVAQSINFIKGPELTEWSWSCFDHCIKLLRMLDYVSLALPNAGMLSDALKNPAVSEHTDSSPDWEDWPSPETPVPTAEEAVAKTMVSNALKEIEVPP